MAWSNELAGHRERDTASVIIASVLSSGPRSQDDRDRNHEPATELADQLFELTGNVIEATGIDRYDLAEMIGCSEPDPLVWRDAATEDLLRSIDVVWLIVDQLRGSVRTDPDAAIAFLSAQTAPDGPEPELASLERDHISILEARLSARDCLSITLEVLSRLRSDIDDAREVLNPTIDGHVSIASLIRDSQVGAARRLAVERSQAIRASERFELSTRDAVIARFGAAVVQAAEIDAAEHARARLSPEAQSSDPHRRPAS